MLTDLSKGFDCLDHELLIAKVNAYGFSLPVLRLINDYSSNRRQRTKIGNSFSDWFEVILGIPQGSIFDYNTRFTSASNNDDLIDSLERASSSFFKWFKDNLFKGNPDKCHLLVSTNEKRKINIREFSIENSGCEKLLRVKIDNKLTFNCHVSDMCKKSNRKINALVRIAPFIIINKRCIVMNSFFRSQFNYCPLIWMCHSRTKIGK